MDNSYKIYVSTFSKKIYHKKQYEIPIEVGAAVPRDFIYSVRDNEGDNISSENPYMGELTALYWIWKNTESEYAGLTHYNKGLKISPSKAENILNSGHDVIVAELCLCAEHARRWQYDKFTEILKSYNSQFYNFYSSCYNSAGGGYGYLTNMFIAKREFLNEYCEFLFPLMQKVREAVGDVEDEKYYQRYCAFLAERLMKPYVEYKKAKAYECKTEVRVNFGHVIFCKWYGLNKKILPPKLYDRFRERYEKKLRISSYKK